MGSTVTDRISGLSTSVAVKAPVDAVTSGNVTLSGLGVQAGGAWISSLTAGDRVLVKDQDDAKENGVYTAFTSEWRRTRDFDGARDVVKGTIVPLASNGDRYRVTAENPVVVGITEISFQIHPNDDRVIRVSSVSEGFATADQVDGYQFIPNGFYEGEPLSVPAFRYKSSYSKSLHDGFRFVSPTVPPISEQAGSTLKERRDNFLAGTGETDPSGNGVFMAGGEIVVPEYYGAFGTGLVGEEDDAAVVAAANSQFYKMIGKPTATYLMSGQCDLVNQINFYLAGATFDFKLTSQAAAFYAKSDFVEIHGGTITVTGSGGAETGGDGHSLNCITSGVQADGSGWKGLKAHHLTVSTNRTDAGAHIGLIGECTNFEIHDIDVPDNDQCRNIIGVEWGGTPVGGTGHPHNGKIYNINIGKITTPTYGGSGYAFAVWLSAAFNIDVENISMETGYGLLMATRGDNANTYAPARYKDKVGRGIRFKNLSINSFYGYALRVIGSYKSATLDEIPMSVSGSGLVAKGGKVGANNNFGIGLEQCQGVEISNVEIFGDLAAGLTTGTNVYDSRINGGSIRDSELYGASLSSNSVRTGFKSVEFKGNNSNGGAGVTTAALYLDNAVDCFAENCVFGEFEDSGETQKYGIYATANAVRPKIHDNHVNSCASGGVGYLFATSSDTDISPTGSNNTFDGSYVPTGFGGCPVFQVMPNGDRSFVANAIPTVGTYKQGDRVYFPSPVASGFIGAVCVADGSPGTWKNWGSISS